PLATGLAVHRKLLVLGEPVQRLRPTSALHPLRWRPTGTARRPRRGYWPAAERTASPAGPRSGAVPGSVLPVIYSQELNQFTYDRLSPCSVAHEFGNGLDQRRATNCPPGTSGSCNTRR